MPYEDLVDRLESRDEPRWIVALPDGSVDHCYAVDGVDGERIEARRELGRQLTGDEGDTFPIERIDVRAGGQAVNAATQIHELGEGATLVGHLDHPALADLPFETYSMGRPARIHVFAFDGEELLFPERAESAAEWGVEELRESVDWDLLTGADALCVVNWTTFRGVTAVFERLAETAPDDVPVVFDPGAIGIAEEASIAALFDALSAADATLDVVLSVNQTECETAADIAGVDGDSLRALLAEVRSAIEITAVVRHGTDDAIVATRGGTAAVEMLPADEPTTTMGAGDRFSGGLACALARGWPWPVGLALGNACAAYFVETAETGDWRSLKGYVENRR